MTTAMEAPKTKKADAAAKLTLPLRTLQMAMATIAPAVQRHTTIPILGMVRIEQTDAAITFAATNLDMSITVTAATPLAMAAAPFVLPALKLNEYAKLLRGEDVSLTVADERATLRCGRSTTKLLSMPVGNFPLVAVSPRTADFTLRQAVLERMLHYAGFAVSEEESKYTLAGAQLEVGGGTVYMVATDGHRLSRYTAAIDTQDAVKALLPAGMLKALAKTLDGDSDVPVWMEATDESIFAGMKDSSGSIEIACRKMTGSFPNYRAVIPATYAVRFWVNATAMTEALRRCMKFADERSGAVKLTISHESIQLDAASTDAGQTDETVDVMRTDAFERFVTGFNGVYLLDAFSRLAGDVEVRFQGRDGKTPMMLVAEPHEGERFEYVAMPMRV